MAVIATDVSRYAQLVKAEFWTDKGWGKEVSATVLPFGTVAKKTAGVWAALTVAPVAGDVLGVVTIATEEDATRKLIIVKGPVILAKESLVVPAGIAVAAIAALEAANMQIADQV